jgi:hypothetical protein
MKTFFAPLAALWRADFFSPKDFVRRALVIALFYLVVHLAGLREFTSLLNGTVGSVQLGWGLSGFLGLTYIFAYLAFVLLVPVLLLAAALLVAWRRFQEPKSQPSFVPVS